MDITYACNTLSLESTERTSTGLQPEVAAVLSYVLGWVTGIFFLIAERENKFVRFHALQSTILVGTLTIAGILLALVPVVGSIINVFLIFGAFILWIELIVKASMRETCNIPFATRIARRMAHKA